MKGYERIFRNRFCAYTQDIMEKLGYTFWNNIHPSKVYQMLVFSINNNKEPKKAQKTFNKYNLLYKRFPANHLRFPLMCPSYHHLPLIGP